MAPSKNVKILVRSSHELTPFIKEVGFFHLCDQLFNAAEWDIAQFAKILR